MKDKEREDIADKIKSLMKALNREMIKAHDLEMGYQITLNTNREESSKAQAFHLEIRRGGLFQIEISNICHTRFYGANTEEDEG